MDDWFSSISAETRLRASAIYDLRKDGFVVIPGPVPTAKLAELAHSYDRAVSQAPPDDIAAGSTTIRVSDFVNSSSDFDDLYLDPPILQACCRVIEQPFKLSTMLARTLKPQTMHSGPMSTSTVMLKVGRWAASFS